MLNQITYLMPQIRQIIKKSV